MRIKQNAIFLSLTLLVIMYSKDLLFWLIQKYKTADHLFEGFLDSFAPGKFFKVDIGACSRATWRANEKSQLLYPFIDGV